MVQLFGKITEKELLFMKLTNVDVECTRGLHSQAWEFGVWCKHSSFRYSNVRSNLSDGIWTRFEEVRRPGVNFTNILWVAFSSDSQTSSFSFLVAVFFNLFSLQHPKLVKMGITELTKFFFLKATFKMLVELTTVNTGRKKQESCSREKGESPVQGKTRLNCWSKTRWRIGKHYNRKRGP